MKRYRPPCTFRWRYPSDGWKQDSLSGIGNRAITPAPNANEPFGLAPNGKTPLAKGTTVNRLFIERIGNACLPCRIGVGSKSENGAVSGIGDSAIHAGRFHSGNAPANGIRLDERTGNDFLSFTDSELIFVYFDAILIDKTLNVSYFLF
ncbi:hypothetical protein [Oxalobacter paraformigenes]|uniref:hypothetical protein n=1 Tax=Oxalobacter paraformigenes TaxID=556268 RepID=UPI001C9CF86F|nr:hypothetical protein [Oxalobacter paraformigenes]